MSREIKFRAWDYNNECIIPWEKIRLEKEEDEHTFSVVVFDGVVGDHYDDFPYMQYTGLEDKNGKEIYEGDIVKVVDCEGSMEMPDTGIGVVEWFNDWGFYNVTEIENGLGELVHGMHVEIIGNIYENPELLEATA